ncbi:ATP-dependent DNA ligase [sediment metagenome]|uniref:ATP-dependent DNA ligase n=1 Tax=sediment metagenome TaxID=749907 RepID=D9PH76_9ZZZZ
MGRKIALSLTAVDIGVELFHIFIDPWIKNQIRGALHMAYGTTMKIKSRKRKPAKKQTEYNDIPERVESRIGKLYIQRHEASHLHHDVSIVDNNGIELFRGAVSKDDIANLFPLGDTKRTSFARQPQHSKGLYGYNWSGTIKEGYGKGVQTVVFKEDIEIIKTHVKGEIIFNIYKTDTNKVIVGKFALIDMKNKDDKAWICSRMKNEEPTIKGKNEFKLISNESGSQTPTKALELESKLAREGKAYTVEAKIDGGANLIKFDKSGNQIYSWRDGKREKTIFLQDKFPEIRDDIHPEFNGTVARGELIYVPNRKITPGLEFKEFGFEHPNLLAKFSLISNPLRSRYEQKISRGQSAIVIYDIAKIKGRSCKSLTYREKREIMEDIAHEHKRVFVPKRFDSVEDGWNEVVVKRNGEGLIIKLLDEVTPDPQFNPDAQAWWKVKKTDAHDLKIVGWKPLVRKGGKVDKNQMGVLIVENGEIHSEVGTGFTEYQREWFAANIDEVLKNDSVIKVKAHHVTDGGSLHGPVFQSVHIEKSEGPILELGLYETADALDTNPYALKSAAGWRA